MTYRDVIPDIHADPWRGEAALDPAWLVTLSV